MHVGHKD